MVKMETSFFENTPFKNKIVLFLMSVFIFFDKPDSHQRCTQGVKNRREIQLTRFALPYDYTCFADGTPFE